MRTGRPKRCWTSSASPALAGRPATDLSGGQQQRVALARSIALEPRALLFDEPLSNLDANLRERMRFELHDLLRRLQITSIFVTHDQAEAFVISDRICVMEAGRIVQAGTPNVARRVSAQRLQHGCQGAGRRLRRVECWNSAARQSM